MKTLAREDCRDEIVHRLRNLRPDNARRWGRMSAHQMVCHLTDSFRMMLGKKIVSHARPSLPRPVMKWIALYLPLRWPPGIMTRPEVDQYVDGTKPTEFSHDVAELETLMEFITTRESGSSWPAHPIFGRMSHSAWLRWGYLHMDHHLRQFGA